MALLFVVDENELTRQPLCTLLAGWQHEVVTCEPGNLEHEISIRQPAAIVITLGADLPASLSLIQNLKRGERNYIPLLVIGEQDSEATRRAALRHGADVFLPRTFKPAELQQQLDLILDASAHRRVLARQQADLIVLQEYREDLANLITNELKNPLASVATSLDNLSKLLHGHTEALEVVGTAQQSTSLLQRVIGNLIDVELAEGGRILPHRSHFTIAELFATTARSYERAVRMRGVTLEVTATDIALEADRDMLQRVLSNLVENALRYVNQGGRVFLHATAEADRVIIVSANTGPPVPLKNRRVIFEKFAHMQRHSGVARLDLGLGLYFCRLIIEAHGGTINVEETPEFPTVFVIDLPVSGS